MCSCVKLSELSKKKDVLGKLTLFLHSLSIIIYKTLGSKRFVTVNLILNTSDASSLLSWLLHCFLLIPLLAIDELPLHPCHGLEFAAAKKMIATPCSYSLVFLKLLTVELDHPARDPS